MITKITRNWHTKLGKKLEHEGTHWRKTYHGKIGDMDLTCFQGFSSTHKSKMMVQLIRWKVRTRSHPLTAAGEGQEEYIRHKKDPQSR